MSIRCIQLLISGFHTLDTRFNVLNKLDPHIKEKNHQRFTFGIIMLNCYNFDIF